LESKLPAERRVLVEVADQSQQLRVGDHLEPLGSLALELGLDLGAALFNVCQHEVLS